jgi:hypothetical protein
MEQRTASTVDDKEHGTGNSVTEKSWQRTDLKGLVGKKCNRYKTAKEIEEEQ